MCRRQSMCAYIGRGLRKQNCNYSATCARAPFIKRAPAPLLSPISLFYYLFEQVLSGAATIVVVAAVPRNEPFSVIGGTAEMCVHNRTAAAFTSIIFRSCPFSRDYFLSLFDAAILATNLFCRNSRTFMEFFSMKISWGLLITPQFCKLGIQSFSKTKVLI